VPIPTPDSEQERVPLEAAGDVFVIGADGTGERSVTSSTAFEQGPAWSPDGTRLAYLSSEDGERYRLTTLPMDGAVPVGRPTLGPESEFAVWSPDATQLLWVGGGQSASGEGVSLIQVIDRDLAKPATAIASVAGLILCAPSWASASR
jgi:Tol biopolymer transport system component